ncbi:hypothetical protein POM88_014235 [Heracleum sosnowskyi]|uniref:Uncharacterized protein n=1 Tax=Heracleum sosnowskyi TaxID=360622 RepID=A0AAD8N3F7_9APIA|nr:hypothetical protein POM88_014235 [Heracleum sosnowskyi]
MICQGSLLHMAVTLKEQQELSQHRIGGSSFAQKMFPGFAAESLAEEYYANGGDLTLTSEMLTQLELQVEGGINQGHKVPPALRFYLLTDIEDLVSVFNTLSSRFHVTPLGLYFPSWTLLSSSPYDLSRCCISFMGLGVSNCVGDKQVALAKPVINLLSKDYHKKQQSNRPNVVQALMEGLRLSHPQPRMNQSAQSLWLSFTACLMKKI